MAENHVLVNAKSCLINTDKTVQDFTCSKRIEATKVNFGY